MGGKIAVIIMLVITVVILTYLFILVITGGKKEKLNFKRIHQDKKAFLYSRKSGFKASTKRKTCRTKTS